MSFLDLANELILTVAEDLDTDDVLSLLHVNQRLSSLLTPLFVGHMIERDGPEGALFWATALRSEPTVRAVLKSQKAGSIGVVTNGVNPPLPSNGADPRLVQFVMDMNIILEVKPTGDSPPTTPLHWAVHRGKLRLIRILIHNKLQVNTAPWGLDLNTSEVYCKLWNDALLEAAGIGAEEAAVMFLDNYANIEVEDPESLRPLHRAVGGKHLGMVKLLLEKGADARGCAFRFAPPYSAIDMAIDKGYVHIWTLMMRHVGVDFKDYKNKPALVHAAEVGDLDLVEYLLENGVDITMKDVNRRTALHLAAKGGFSDICRLLMENGADPDAVDGAGRVPLHTAALSRPGPAAIQVLLDMGADVTIQDSRLCTPLHFAGKNMYASEEDIKALIDAGAPMDVKNMNDKTPQQVLASMSTPRFSRS